MSLYSSSAPLTQPVSGASSSSWGPYTGFHFDADTDSPYVPVQDDSDTSDFDEEGLSVAQDTDREGMMEGVQFGTGYNSGYSTPSRSGYGDATPVPSPSLGPASPRMLASRLSENSELAHIPLHVREAIRHKYITRHPQTWLNDLRAVVMGVANSAFDDTARIAIGEPFEDEKFQALLQRRGMWPTVYERVPLCARYTEAPDEEWEDLGPEGEVNLNWPAPELAGDGAGNSEIVENEAAESLRVELGVLAKQVWTSERILREEISEPQDESRLPSSYSFYHQPTAVEKRAMVNEAHATVDRLLHAIQSIRHNSLPDGKLVTKAHRKARRDRIPGSQLSGLLMDWESMLNAARLAGVPNSVLSSARARLQILLPTSQRRMDDPLERHQRHAAEPLPKPRVGTKGRGGGGPRLTPVQEKGSLEGTGKATDAGIGKTGLDTKAANHAAKGDAEGWATEDEGEAEGTAAGISQDQDMANPAGAKPTSTPNPQTPPRRSKRRRDSEAMEIDDQEGHVESGGAGGARRRKRVRAA
ncbi:uncharacterized protein EV422DRAFT_548727 [Fimicolochytrium jonesii]|uniref:uncharacterized protein n=1 Tax=Fimicolochytrium jonesii TaxID=1396493 RepID=UPI0022FF392C|nr:uncharacterized protein EV422DRAFT_548727 [Fimicolochytrium jonesii]KAI8815606.1 hypothetical protein EV422DRAFT_548727 [Fimicolochytrium jonesii]